LKFKAPSKFALVVPTRGLFDLAPSMERLKERLRTRGDDDEHIVDRLSSAPAELEKGHQLASHVIVNDDLQRASAQILLYWKNFASCGGTLHKGLTFHGRTPTLVDPPIENSWRR